MLVRFLWYLDHLALHQLKKRRKKNVRVGTALTILSGFAHDEHMPYLVIFVGNGLLQFLSQFHIESGLLIKFNFVINTDRSLKNLETISAFSMDALAVLDFPGFLVSSVRRLYSLSSQPRVGLTFVKSDFPKLSISSQEMWPESQIYIYNSTYFI